MYSKLRNMLNVIDNLVPNINVLGDCGVPQTSISGFPFKKHSNFVENVKLAKRIWGLIM